MRSLLPLLLIVAALLCGCANDASKLRLVGIDTSGSAREYQLAFERAARDANELTAANGKLEIYRFDTLVHEVHVGGQLGPQRFKDTIRAALAEDRGQKGTSLLKLAQRFDERLVSNIDRKAELLICTDCGVELMNETDLANLKTLADKWATGGQVESIRVVGVRPMHREAIRTAFSAFGERLVME